MQDEKLLDQHHELLFGVRRSHRYHARRVMFFSSVHKTIRVASVLSGLGAFSAAMAATGGDGMVKGFAAVVATLAAIDLVIGCEAAARRHACLQREFIALERELVVAAPAITADELVRLTAKRLEIEMTEPPILRVLDALCHNELARAMGCDLSHMARIAWWQRFFAPVCDLFPSRIKSLS